MRSAQKPVVQFKPRGESARQFKALAEEVLARIAAHAAPLEVASHG